MSGTDKGELSSTQVGQDVSQGSQSHSGSSQEENNTLYTHRPLARSASPAVKRPRADMEAGNSDSVHEDVEMVISSVGAGEREAPKDRDLTPAIQLNGESHRFDESKPNSIGMPQDESMDDESAGSQLPIATNNTDGSFTPSPVPPIDEQVETIMKLAEKPFVNRQKLYLVSRKWLNRAVARSSHKDQVPNLDKAAAEGDIGPVDNSDIAAQDPELEGLKDEADEPFVALKEDLEPQRDFEALPQNAWDLLINWYGIAPDSPIIVRFAYGSPGQPADFDKYAQVFTILKLRNESHGLDAQAIRERDNPPLRLVASRYSPFNEFLKRAKLSAGIELKTKIRIWVITGNSAYEPAIATPAASRGNSPAPSVRQPADLANKLVLDLNTFLSLEVQSQRELLDIKDYTGDDNYNGHSNFQQNQIMQGATLVLEEQIGGAGGGEWISDNVTRNAQSNGVSVAQKTGLPNLAKAKGSRLGGNLVTSAASTGIMARGRARKDGRSRGSIGLQNLGNTCYMNSALQCVRSVEELTRYFLRGKFQDDLNPDNPLSHHGEVASAYAQLMTSMYGDDVRGSFTPRVFKSVIGKYGPSFSGFAQQDSQEFLGFLLDGLGEDLNRVLKKPYIEKPDSTDEMVHDPVALQELADRCWSIFKARNDSVIVDLFAGTYKSTLVCPVCSKVSITFDPFNTLTLQLPLENLWSRIIHYVPLKEPIIKIRVEIEKYASIRTLKEFVGKRVNVDASRLFAGEVYSNMFFKHYQDGDIVSDEIGPNDEAWVYELEDQPTNFPGEKPQNFYSSDESAWTSPMANKMLVPILHRASRGIKRREISLYPTFIMVTPEEARDYHTILRKVLRQVGHFTLVDVLSESGESELGPSSNEYTDVEAVTEDDSEGQTGRKIQANSLDGEEDFVDVTMHDPANRDVEEKIGAVTDEDMADQNGTSVAQDSPHSTGISERLRSGMEISVFGAGPQEGTEPLVPLGWSTFRDSKYANLPFATLISRISATPSSTSSENDYQVASPANSTSPPDEDQAIEDFPIEQNDYGRALQETYPTSSDDELPSITEFVSRDKPPRLPISKAGKAYSKKTNNRSKGPDRGPLIRLGEALLVDWDSALFDDLFHKESSTYDVRTLIDEELLAKQKMRDMRKRKGVTLGDCLDEFGKEEILSEQDTWYCPRCKEHRRASKKFELWKCPDILVIHLKRFSAGTRGWRDKLEVLVDFPVEGLDMSDRVVMKEEDKDMAYDLIAVDNHYGGLGGGHYTAFARNFEDDKWYDYNDSSVMRKNPDTVVTAAAYLLFYRRRSNRPLGGPLLEKVLEAEEPESESQLSSRGGSPAGEGQRLVDFSLNGSSSALHGVGAAHHGTDGSASANRATTINEGEDEELPAYIEDDRPQPSGDSTLGDMDDEENFNNQGSWNNMFPLGYGGSGYGGLAVHDTSWSFGNVEQAHSDAGDSANALHGSDSSTSLKRGQHEAGSDLEDFGEPQPAIHEPQERNPNTINHANAFAADDNMLDKDDATDDPPVAEVRVEEDEAEQLLKGGGRLG